MSYLFDPNQRNEIDNMIEAKQDQFADEVEEGVDGKVFATITDQAGHIANVITTDDDAKTTMNKAFADYLASPAGSQAIIAVLQGTAGQDAIKQAVPVAAAAAISPTQGTPQSAKVLPKNIQKKKEAGNRNTTAEEQVTKWQPRICSAFKKKKMIYGSATRATLLTTFNSEVPEMLTFLRNIATTCYGSSRGYAKALAITQLKEDWRSRYGLDHNEVTQVFAFLPTAKDVNLAKINGYTI